MGTQRAPAGFQGFQSLNSSEDEHGIAVAEEAITLADGLGVSR